MQLYLTERLALSPKEATTLTSTLTFWAYTMCLPGGIVADVWWGKFKTIWALVSTQLSTYAHLNELIFAVSLVDCLSARPHHLDRLRAAESAIDHWTAGCSRGHHLHWRGHRYCTCMRVYECIYMTCRRHQGQCVHIRCRSDPQRRRIDHRARV